MREPDADIPNDLSVGPAETKSSEESATKTAPHEAGVPRRFGMGILLVIMTMYAVLFAVLKALGTPPLGFVLIAGFFTVVGLGQMILFKGKRPRRASVLVGGCFLPCLYLGVVIYQRWRPHPPDLIGGLIGGIIQGCLLGYLAGLLIAAVFLFIDKVKHVRDKLRHRDASAEQ